MCKKLCISVIMPCYNEGPNIYDNICKVIDIMKEMNCVFKSFEIICVNDGSLDNTYEEILRAEERFSEVKCVSYEKNVGKGCALQAGTAIAIGEYIAFVDSDLELSPTFLESFYEKMIRENADVVIGSKMHPESIVDYPWYRKFLSLGYFIILKTLFRLNIKDTQTGLKLFKAEVIKSVMPKIVIKSYAFDIEVLVLINQKKYKIIDAPIELVFSRGNVRGRIRIKDIWQMFIDTIGIFYQLSIKKIYD